MSYTIHTTEGLVLSYKPLREADRVYSILTRDLGLIRATATGVRKAESKLRGSLEPVSFSSVSLVRGKEYWRATSAETIEKVQYVSEIAKPLSLIERLVQGESSNPELFEAVWDHLRLWTPSTHKEDFETMLVAKTLFHLGYLKDEDLRLSKSELIKTINHGLEMSQLA